LQLEIDRCASRGKRRAGVGYSSWVRDTELYQQVLGLSDPWSVSKVQLDAKKQRVDVWAEHSDRTKWKCPECERVCGLHDHDEERSWRHLDTCQFETYLHARVPRIRCDEHGIKRVRVPWAEPRSRFTAMFERFAIDVLLETDVSGAAKILGISWDEAHGIMRRAVDRGLARRKHAVPKRMGIDEKSLAKGYRFATIVNDLGGPLHDPFVVELAEGRGKDALVKCWGKFSLNDLENVEVVAMDMWEPYMQIVGAGIGWNKIVFDRFHIMMHMNNAVDLVRRRENRALREEGDDRLVGSKHMWLYGRENLPDRYTEAFADLRRANLKTGRAWAIKEMLRDFWDRPSEKAGERWYKRWRAWAVRSRLVPVKQVAAMIHRHLPNVLTYFTHRITNAASEAINSTIQMIKKRAFGFRSFPNFRVAVLFRCGALDLYPRMGAHPNV
jgi:transposase